MSAENSLSKILEKPKNTIQEQDNWEIYFINCEICPRKCVGQTKINFKTWAK